MISLDAGVKKAIVIRARRCTENCFGRTLQQGVPDRRLEGEELLASRKHYLTEIYLIVAGSNPHGRLISFIHAPLRKDLSETQPDGNDRG